MGTEEVVASSNCSPAAETGTPRRAESKKRHSVLVSGAHTVMTNIVQVIGVLGTTAILARSLGPTVKGVYDVYVGASLLLSSLLGLSLNSGISYSVASSPTNISKLLRSVWVIVAVEVVLALIVCRGLSFFHSSRLIVPLELGKSGPVLVVVGVSLLGLAALWRSIVVGQRHFLNANFGDIAKQVAILVALILFLKGIAKSNLVLWAIAANLIATAVAAFSYRVAIDRQETDPQAPTGIKRALRFAFPTHTANVSQMLNARMDIFFVYHYWGAGAVGLYQAAVMLAQAINMIPQATQAVLFPTISALGDSRQESAWMIARTNRVLFCLGIVVAAGLALVAPFFIPHVLGPRFRPSTVGLLLLLPGCVTFVAINVTAAYFAGIGRPDMNMRNSLYGLAATVILDIALIPRWGFWGAAIASSLSYTVTTIGQVFLFRRETGVTLVEMFIPTTSDWHQAKQLFQRLVVRASNSDGQS